MTCILHHLVWGTPSGRKQYSHHWISRYIDIIVAASFISALYERQNRVKAWKNIINTVLVCSPHPDCNNVTTILAMHRSCFHAPAWITSPLHTQHPGNLSHASPSQPSPLLLQCPHSRGRLPDHHRNCPQLQAIWDTFTATILQEGSRKLEGQLHTWYPWKGEILLSTN